MNMVDEGGVGQVAPYAVCGPTPILRRPPAGPPASGSPALRQRQPSPYRGSRLPRCSRRVGRMGGTRPRGSPRTRACYQ
eukprot:scaffold74103_cov60-Phaeocystis_antarctica.AAC.1